MRTIRVCFLAGLLAACGSSQSNGHGPDPTPDPAGSVQAEFEKARDAFYWAQLDAFPPQGVDLGYHKYDGKLPDVSDAALRRNIERLDQAKATFEAFDAAKLSRVSQVEREVLLAEIRGELFDAKVLRLPWRNPMRYMWGLGVSAYVDRDYAPLADRAKGIIGVCDGAGDYLSAAMANLEEEIPKTWLQVALLQVNGMIEFVENDVPREMAGLDDGTNKQLVESLGRCVNAMSEYRDFVQDRMAKATDDYALGEELFLQMLRDKEGVDVPLARLAAIGQADLERNWNNLQQAVVDISAHERAENVVARVMADKPAPDKVIDEATAQSAEMRQFLIDKKIVTIPSDHVAEVRESPPFMRWNFAFLDSPGPFETKLLPAFYYISPPDPKWPKEEQLAYIPFRGDLLFTTIHEVWPGHFLHGLHKKKNESVVLRSFCSYSMSEGWAHYAEEMMWDAGVGNGDPKTRIGMLQNALLRNVRFVSAIGLHTGGMTVDESLALFESKAFADKGNARQQAVRGTFDPGYLNYTLGKLMIRKLHDDWKAKQGDAYSLGAFHDEFLSYGCAPVPVIRRFMLGEDAGPAL